VAERPDHLSDFVLRDVPVLPATDDTSLAVDGGKPASAKSMQSYIARAFGDRPGETRTVMQLLVAALTTHVANRIWLAACMSIVQ